MKTIEEARLYQFLVDEDKITIAHVHQAIHAARHMHEDDIDFANGLFPDAGNYLPSHLCRSLIRAELSNSEPELLTEIEIQKRFFERIRELLPAISRNFSPSETRHIIGILSCVDDCHHDFYVAEKQPRIDRLQRETRETMKIASARLSEAVKTLEAIQKYIYVDFEKYYDLNFHSPSNPSQRRSIEQLISEIKMCSDVLSISVVQADLDDEHLLLVGNDKRRIIVKYAHMMSHMWNGPPLVTTPGSQFSTLCSLLYEAVTGLADEGLSGTINRYARSADRKRADEEEQEFRLDLESDDNFSEQIQKMKWFSKEISLCETLLTDSRLTREAKMLIYLRLGDAKRQREVAESSLGPNQVLPSHFKEEQLKVLEERNFDPRALSLLDRRLGDARRAILTLTSRLDGNDVNTTSAQEPRK